MKAHHTLPLAFPFLLAAPQAADAATIYTTGIPSPATPGDFDITASTSPAGINWYAVMGRHNHHATADNTGARRVGLIDGNDGTGNLNDYLYFQNANGPSSDMDYFAHTSTGSSFLAFSPNQFNNLNASWRVSRDAFATDGGYYLAIQTTSGVWYSSTTNAAAQGTSGIVTINLRSSLWVTINETVGTSLGRGTVTSTYDQLFPSGQEITGVGFYVDDLSAAMGTVDPPTTVFRTLRIDNLVISGDAVPEAGTSALALSGLAFLMVRRRR